MSEQVTQRRRQRRESHGVALCQGEHAQVRSEHRLAGAGLASEQYVLSLVDEVERGEPLDERAIDGPRPLPVEAVEGREGGERRRLRAGREVSPVALRSLSDDDTLDNLRRRSTPFGQLGEQSANRLRGHAEAHRSEKLSDVDGHRSPPSRAERRHDR